jgi:hypothetical protein
VDRVHSGSPCSDPRNPPKKDGKKESPKEKAIAFPEAAVSLIYRTQKPKEEDKRKYPNPRCYAKTKLEKRNGEVAIEWKQGGRNVVDEKVMYSALHFASVANA